MYNRIVSSVWADVKTTNILDKEKKKSNICLAPAPSSTGWAEFYYFHTWELYFPQCHFTRTFKMLHFHQSISAF